MRVKCGVLLLLPLLLGMRDPFQPPASRCPDAALRQWRYVGVVLGKVPVAIVRDETPRWLRLRHGDTLAQGGRVRALDEKELVIDMPGACEPPQWRWQRQGTKQDENRDRGITADRQSGAGRGASPGESGGG